jgi:hypothetical protein
MLLRLAFATLMLSLGSLLLGACDPMCDWELTAQAWEDVNSNGIQDSDEPPLENIAITSGETRSGRTDSFPLVGGTDKDGQVLVLTHRFGYCPERVQVKAIAPEGYVPTTPDQKSVTYKSTTSIGFGFRRVPGSKPPVRLTGTALCSEERFQHTGYISGAVVRPNGDIWVTGRQNGGVTLRRDGKDYSQDIDGFGSYAEDIASAPDGTIWVAGGSNTGVARFDGTAWKTYTTVYGALPSNDVRGIEVTRDGHVWALTSVGPTGFNPSLHAIPSGEFR